MVATTGKERGLNLCGGFWKKREVEVVDKCRDNKVMILAFHTNSFSQNQSVFFVIVWVKHGKTKHTRSNSLEDQTHNNDVLQ